MIKILLVDDHPHVRRLIHEIIETYDDVRIVGETAGYREREGNARAVSRHFNCRQANEKSRPDVTGSRRKNSEYELHRAGENIPSEGACCKRRK